MENLNAEQIKEDIDNCLIGECELCSYYDQTACKEYLMRGALALINSQEQRIKELEAECEQWRSDWEKNQKRWEIAYDELDKEKHDLELTLVGVMFSVDKWLDGAELEQDEVNRAITMREKTLQIIERLAKENERLKTENEEQDEAIIKSLKEMGKIRRETKADTVRKMQERLKKQRFSDASPHDYELLCCFIDGVAKEMLEGYNGIQDK